MFGTERWENQVDFWQTKFTEFKGEMYPTIYQEMACIGGMAIDREVEMLPKNRKNAPYGNI